MFMAILSGVLFAAWQSFSQSFTHRIFESWYSKRRKKIPEKWRFVLQTRSHCDSCQHTLPAYGLIPVLGYFLVKRKCSHCLRSVPSYHPIVEACAFVAGFAVGWMQVSPAWLSITLISYTLILLIVKTDFFHMLIPTEAILGLLVLGLTETLFLRHGFFPATGMAYRDTISWWYTLGSANLDLLFDLGGAIIWYLLFHLIRTLSRHQMGLADVRLVLALGLLLGHPYSIFLPTLAAGLGIIFYFLRKKSVLIYAPSVQKIPFGVFLGMGYLILRAVQAGV